MLLSRAGILRQSPSVRDHADIREDCTAIRVSNHEKATSGQVPSRERENAPREKNSCPYSFSKVELFIRVLMMISRLCYQVISLQTYKFHSQ